LTGCRPDVGWWGLLADYHYLSLLYFGVEDVEGDVG